MAYKQKARKLFKRFERKREVPHPRDAMTEDCKKHNFFSLYGNVLDSFLKQLHCLTTLANNFGGAQRPFKYNKIGSNRLEPSCPIALVKLFRKTVLAQGLILQKKMLS